MTVARFWSIAALAVAGIIIADILIHPTGTKAAAAGISSVTRPTTNALLGVAS